MRVPSLPMMGAAIDLARTAFPATRAYLLQTQRPTSQAAAVDLVSSFPDGATSANPARRQVRAG